MFEWFRSFEQEEGQTLVEYALILALVVIVVVAILSQFSGPLQSIYNSILASLTGAAP
jgi:Flp pilus assembly pilin Flp